MSMVERIFIRVILPFLVGQGRHSQNDEMSPVKYDMQFNQKLASVQEIGRDSQKSCMRVWRYSAVIASGKTIKIDVSAYIKVYKCIF